MSTEFEIGEYTYRTDRKLDAFRQSHIVRRIAPLFAAMLKDGAVAGGLSAQAADLAARLVGNLGPLTEALAAMKDEDADYVLQSCLSLVSRRIPGDKGWTRLMVGSAIAFEDVNLVEMYQIVWNVLQENLAGFFTSLGTGSDDPPAAKAKA